MMGEFRGRVIPSQHSSIPLFQGLHREVSSTVDEVNPKGPPQRRRVLRARDVIPPFDRSVPPAEEGPTTEPPLRRASPTLKPLPASALPPRIDNHPVAVTRPSAPAPTGEAGDASAENAEIPTYNLAVNILAEQRRAAGRRRRAPGRPPEKTVTPSKGSGVRLFLPEPASQDLLELQQIVAQIVARDIERLCKRPERPPFAVSA